MNLVMSISRPGARAQLRPEDRRGHARRGAREPGGDRGLPRERPMPLLELANVEARYGPIRALHGVSLTVDEGEVVALLGANGAGKTTTLRAVSGLRAQVRRRRVRRALDRASARPRRRAARRRARPRGPRPLRRADGLGQPAHGRVRPRRAEDAQDGGAARARLLPLARGAARTSRRARSAAASSRCSRSRARSSRARGCSCSTSRRSGSRRR